MLSTTRRDPLLFAFLAVAVGLSAAACKEKPSSFFAPDLEGPAPPPGVTVADFTGPTTTSYQPDSEASTCTPVPDPFETGATIEDTGAMEGMHPVVAVVFPDAPEGGEITGPLNLSTGDFEGETEEVDNGAGLTAVERWSVDFSWEGAGDTFSGSYSGTSEVTFTDMMSGASCQLVYDIQGTVGGS